MNYNSYPHQGQQYPYYQGPSGGSYNGAQGQPVTHGYPPPQPAPLNRYCNLCNSSIDEATVSFWHCNRCASGDFDMCDPCMRRGGQCFCGTFNANIDYRSPPFSAQTGTAEHHAHGYQSYQPPSQPLVPAMSPDVQAAEDGEKQLMALLDARLQKANEAAAGASSQAATAPPADAQNAQNDPTAANEAAKIAAAAGSHLVQMQHLQLLGMQHSFNMGGFGGLV